MKVDFREQLQRQFLFLESSAAAYDRGVRVEAVRIATSLRVICHTTKQSTSPLAHLNAEGISLLSTSAQAKVPIPAGFGPLHNVTNHIELDVVTKMARAKPWLDAAPTKAIVPFSDWWNNEPMFANHGVVVTRRSLVRWAANQDGGAHVDEDPHLD